MRIKRTLRKLFPGISKAYINHLWNKQYKIRLVTDPRDYPEMIMKEWTDRGFKPFDLEHPVTYRQKIQWAKLYEKDERKTRLTDKVLVRDWIKDTIGGDYLIPVYGIYSSPEEIDFDSLPEKFVLKMNHSSGMNIIVKDKSKLNRKAVRKQLNEWLKIDFSLYAGYQLQYSGIVPKILAEKYMADSSGDLPDYKFLCFGGKPYFCWVDLDRFGNHTRNIYDMEWKLQPWRQHCNNSERDISKPQNFDRMTKIAEILCKDFAQVRVDLYNLDGQIYFGEMTFSNGNGFEKIIPEEYDKIIGDMWKINCPH